MGLPELSSLKSQKRGLKISIKEFWNKGKLPLKIQEYVFQMVFCTSIL